MGPFGSKIDPEMDSIESVVLGNTVEVSVVGVEVISIEEPKCCSSLECMLVVSTLVV